MVSTYKVKIWCRNCEYKGKADLPKNTMIEENKCPVCGNRSINKNNDITLTLSRLILIGSIIIAIFIPPLIYIILI